MTAGGWQRSPSGKAMQYLRQRYGQTHTPASRLNFSQLTEEKYRELLEAEGMSEKFIENELELLRAYRARATAYDRERRDNNQRRRDAAENAPWLQDYIDADERRKERLKEKEDDG